MEAFNSCLRSFPENTLQALVYVEMNIRSILQALLYFNRRDFQMPPIQGPPHDKCICPYLALVGKMFLQIMLNNNISAYNEGAPNRGPLNIPICVYIYIYDIPMVQGRDHAPGQGRPARRGGEGREERPGPYIYMYIYIYIYMYMCIAIYISLSLSLYVYIYIYVYMDMYVYILYIYIQRERDTCVSWYSYVLRAGRYSWKLVGHHRKVTLTIAWLQSDYYPTLCTQ